MPRLEAALPGPLPLFPATHWWNVDVSAAPVDPGSDGFVDYIDAEGVSPLHPDFGGTLPDGVSIYGFPYIVVGGEQPKKTVQFEEPSESDGVDHSTETSYPFYPIPDEAITQAHWIEGGAPGNVDLTDDQDRHMLIVDRDNRHLYELYNVYYDGSTWHAFSGAFFDLKTNDRRPDGWTSADAAGLAILPGLVRYDEAYGEDEIRHAFRFTVRHTKGYVYPASHQAGLQDPPALPMGARLRLKPGVQVASPDPGVQRIVRALKTYGMIVADNGTDMYVSGTWDDRWDNDILNPALDDLTADDFEVVELGWQPPLAPTLAVDERAGRNVEPERGARAGRVRDRRAVLGEPGRGGGGALGRGLGVHRASRRDVLDRRRDRELRLTRGGRSRELLRGGRELLPADGLGSPRPARPLHWDAAVTEKVNLTAAKTWTLHVGESFSDVAPRAASTRDREPLPQRRDRRLQRGRVLSVRVRHPRADGGIPPEGEVRPRLPAARRLGDDVRRRSARAPSPPTGSRTSPRARSRPAAGGRTSARARP